MGTLSSDHHVGGIDTFDAAAAFSRARGIRGDDGASLWVRCRGLADVPVAVSHSPEFASLRHRADGAMVVSPGGRCTPTCGWRVVRRETQRWCGSDHRDMPSTPDRDRDRGRAHPVGHRLLAVSRLVAGLAGVDSEGPQSEHPRRADVRAIIVARSIQVAPTGSSHPSGAEPRATDTSRIRRTAALSHTAVAGRMAFADDPLSRGIVVGAADVPCQPRWPHHGARRTRCALLLLAVPADGSAASQRG